MSRPEIDEQAQIIIYLIHGMAYYIEHPQQKQVHVLTGIVFSGNLTATGSGDGSGQIIGDGVGRRGSRGGFQGEVQGTVSPGGASHCRRCERGHRRDADRVVRRPRQDKVFGSDGAARGNLGDLHAVHHVAAEGRLSATATAAAAAARRLLPLYGESGWDGRVHRSGGGGAAAACRGRGGGEHGRDRRGRVERDGLLSPAVRRPRNFGPGRGRRVLDDLRVGGESERIRGGGTRLGGRRARGSRGRGQKLLVVRHLRAGRGRRRLGRDCRGGGRRLRPGQVVLDGQLGPPRLVRSQTGGLRGGGAQSGGVRRGRSGGGRGCGGDAEPAGPECRILLHAIEG